MAETKGTTPRPESSEPAKGFDRRAFIEEIKRLQAELPRQMVDSTTLLREDRDR